MPEARELKINVHVPPLDGLRMADYDFTCTFFTTNPKKITIKKRDMVKVDDDNYIAVITSELGLMMGRGVIHLIFSADIPDADFPDGFRKEIDEICTGIPNKIAALL